MICQPCRQAADGPDRTLGHLPETCRDHDRQIRACGCQHRPIKPKETR